MYLSVNCGAFSRKTCFSSTASLYQVWSHHNLRIAYMAQHSLHHVEKHLEKSPVQYMQWRFGTTDGTDRSV